MAQYQAGTELRIVLLGKTGVGKSHTGNTLLAKKAFVSSRSFKSSTVESSKATATVDGVNVTVVDTPGFADTHRPVHDVQQSIAKCMYQVKDGIHVFAYTMRPDRFTKEDSAVAELTTNLFGPDILKHLVLVVTRRDDFDGQNVDDFFEPEAMPDSFRKLYEGCNKRVVVIENKSDDLDGERGRFYDSIKQWDLQTRKYVRDPQGFMEKIIKHMKDTGDLEPDYNDSFWLQLKYQFGQMWKSIVSFLNV